jgi:predicted ATPase/DNA-binding winged helix-turn-helix (wHTH) protein
MMDATPAVRPLSFDRVEIRPHERRVLVDGVPASLGARAFDLLLALIERRERLVAKAELLDLVWPDTIVEENNLQVHISALRKVLGSAAITTVPGRGYRFTLHVADDVPVASAQASVEHSPAPPLRRNNLPAAIETLIGRAADVESVAALLDRHRLVTVLGPGGIGKTRLALDVARGQGERCAQGTWWVDLASTSSGDRVAATIASAAALQLGERDAATALARALAHSHTLLVLDNCEHLVADVAPLVQSILEASRDVTVLTTSQVPLKLPAEHVYRLDALDVPPVAADVDEDLHTDVDTARQFGAIQLLERRAHAADRRFALAPHNVAAATDICRALDGVALAIEMAAARIPWMGIDAVRDHLNDRLRLLVSANRVARDRHQTLRATLDWSHALLSPVEQAVLRRVAAFAGSFTLGAARMVASGDALDDWDVLDALAGLVDKSLLGVEHLDPPRYRLLETTRLYAVERLQASDECAEVRACHRAALGELARDACGESWSLADDAWAARYADDYADLEAAFNAAVTHDDADVVAETCDALRTLDTRRGVMSRLRARMEQAHRLASCADGRIAARLWDGVTPADQIAIDGIPRLDAAQRRVAAWRPLRDAQALYRALLTAADEEARARDFPAADRALAEAEALENPAWPPRLRLLLASERGAVAMYREDADGYRHSKRAVLALAEQAGATRSALSARLGLGDAALLAEDYEEARVLCQAVVDQLRGMNRPVTLGIALENLSCALAHLGDLPAAHAAVMASLPLMRDNEAGADLFNVGAFIAARCRRFVDAAHMLGHVDAWVARSQYTLAPNEARLYASASVLVDSALGAGEHARLRTAGARLTDAEADALLAGLDASVPG